MKSSFNHWVEKLGHFGEGLSEDSILANQHFVLVSVHLHFGVCFYLELSELVTLTLELLLVLISVEVDLTKRMWFGWIVGLKFYKLTFQRLVLLEQMFTDAYIRIMHTFQIFLLV